MEIDYEKIYNTIVQIIAKRENVEVATIVERRETNEKTIKIQN
jgi:hypothetical protein